MNKILLILFLCASAIVSKADGDIINEDFSEGFEGLERLNMVNEIKGWNFFFCEFVKNDDFGCGIKLSGQNSYVESPPFDSLVTTKVVLSFSYSNVAKDVTRKLLVTINNGGKFENNTDTVTFTITKNPGTFTSATLDIFEATRSTTLTFSVPPGNNYFAIGEVKVTSSRMLLSESEKSVIEPKTTDVELTRTLTGEIWNTFCLPFDVNQTILEQALGEDQNIQLRTYTSYAEGAMHFSKVDQVEAGTPFLIKLNNTVKNPTFVCVDVKDTPAQIVDYDDVKFVGVYNPEELPDDDDNVYMFLTANGTLMKPNSNSRTLKGMRAYFSVPVKEVANARIAFDDDGITSVNKMPPPTTVDDIWYTLSGGRYAQQPVKGGLYIKNGKKIIIK